MSGVSSSIDSGNNSATKLGLLCLFRFRKTRISALAPIKKKLSLLLYKENSTAKIQAQVFAPNPCRESHVTAWKNPVFSGARDSGAKKVPPRHEGDQAQFSFSQYSEKRPAIVAGSRPSIIVPSPVYSSFSTWPYSWTSETRSPWA
jgi:hypothetical protein